MMWDIMQAGRRILAGTAGVTNWTGEFFSAMIDSAAKGTSATVEGVHKFLQFITDKLSHFFGFGN